VVASTNACWDCFRASLDDAWSCHRKISDMTWTNSLFAKPACFIICFCNIIVATLPYDFAIFGNQHTHFQNESNIVSTSESVSYLSKHFLDYQFDREQISVTNFGNRAQVEMLHTRYKLWVISVYRIISLDGLAVRINSYWFSASVEENLTYHEPHNCATPDLTQSLRSQLLFSSFGTLNDRDKNTEVWKFDGPLSLRASWLNILRHTAPNHME